VTDHARTVAIVAGSEPPVVSVPRFTPMGPGDWGYSVILSDVDPDDDDPSDSELVCLRCLVDDHPEVGVALDLAREHGQVDLDESGEWVVGDLSRLSDDKRAKPKRSLARPVLTSPPALLVVPDQDRTRRPNDLSKAADREAKQRRRYARSRLRRLPNPARGHGRRRRGGDGGGLPADR
jgi:hypothetical protein